MDLEVEQPEVFKSYIDYVIDCKYPINNTLNFIDCKEDVLIIGTINDLDHNKIYNIVSMDIDDGLKGLVLSELNNDVYKIMNYHFTDIQAILNKLQIYLFQEWFDNYNNLSQDKLDLIIEGINLSCNAFGFNFVKINQKDKDLDYLSVEVVSNNKFSTISFSASEMNYFLNEEYFLKIYNQ